jgi:hypothetical protein
MTRNMEHRSLWADKVDAVVVLREQTDDAGVSWIAVAGASDWRAMKTLPQVVRYEGRVYGQTGWNSDRGEAYYSTGAKVAQAVRS